MDYSVVTKPEPHLHLNRKDAGEAKSEYGKYSSIPAEAIDEDIAQKAETCASKEMNEGAEYLLMKMMKSLWHLPKTLVLMEMVKR